MNDTIRPHLLSIDLGPVAGPAVERIGKRHSISKAEVVRRAVLIVHTFNLFDSWDRIEKRMVERAGKVKRGPQKQTMEEKQVVARYRKTYNYAGRIHTAAILSCIRSLTKQGITTAEIASMVEVSTKDPWLANRLNNGEHIPLNEILSEKMVNRLLPLLENTEQAELESAALALEGTTKPKAFAYLKSVLPPESLSAAWDDIQAAASNSEVEAIITQYTEKEHDGQ